MSEHNERGVRIYEKARKFALIAHGGQTRKYPDKDGNDIPYVNHPMSVSKRVRHYVALDGFLTLEVYILQAAAMLHDVIEDTDFTKEDLWVGVDPLVASYVDQLTNVPKSFGNRKERQEFQNIKLKFAVDSVKFLKVLDRLDNLSDDGIVDNDPKFAKVYLNETDELIKTVKQNTENNAVLAAINDLERVVKKLRGRLS